jgi:hypothetical protein
MSHTQKEKLEERTNIPIQFITEISTEECAVTAADGCTLDSSSEKRKEEENKPIYIKRI